MFVFWYFANETYNTDPDKFPWPQYSSSGVREHTAELANLALSDVTPIHSGTPPRAASSSHLNIAFEYGFLDSRATGRPGRSRDVINEVSEPSTPDAVASTARGKSYLTHLFRNSPPEVEPEARKPSSEMNIGNISNATLSSNEQTFLLPKAYPEAGQRREYDAIPQDDGDIESQHDFRPIPVVTIKKAITWPKEKGLNAVKNVFYSKTWNKKDIWENGVLQTASYLPAVFLGLLLNILDGLSYGMNGESFPIVLMRSEIDGYAGMILFPLGHDVFSGLGPDGLSIFYVSCIVSQLVYSCGGSVFKGGIGSEMVGFFNSQISLDQSQ